MQPIKTILVVNGADVAPLTYFNTTAHGAIFVNTINAACKHLGLEAPENVDEIETPFIIGSENDLYHIKVTDASASDTIDYAAAEGEKIEAAEAAKVSHSFELEFTDSEEKGVLIDLLRDAVTETTGEEMKGGTLANFEAFINKNDSKINAIVGQTKFNSFALTEDQNAALIAEDIASGLRPDPNAPKLEEAANQFTAADAVDTTDAEPLETAVR